MAVWTVCVSLCLLFALNASACESGWSRHGKRCFKVFNNPMSWKDAEVTCLNHGGNLASVHSNKEQAFIKLLVSSSNPFWIGGYDAVSEGTWFWSDGSKMNFQLWSPGEPNNWVEEHCIETNYGACWAGWSAFGCRCFRFFNNPQIWIEAEEGVWLWNDGSKFNFQIWFPGEPSDEFNEDCLEMNFKNGNWNDLPCSERRLFVCEMKPQVKS